MDYIQPKAWSEKLTNAGCRALRGASGVVKSHQLASVLMSYRLGRSRQAADGHGPCENVVVAHRVFTCFNHSDAAPSYSSGWAPGALRPKS